MTATYVGLNPEKWNVLKVRGRWHVYEPRRLTSTMSFRGWHAAVLYALHNAKARSATQREAVERIITRPVEVT